MDTTCNITQQKRIQCHNHNSNQNQQHIMITELQILPWCEYTAWMMHSDGITLYEPKCMLPSLTKIYLFIR